MTKPNEPTQTCSEVVERLRKECLIPVRGVGGILAGTTLDRAKAETVLHSWRERRVQELEKLLAEVQFGMDVCSICFSNQYDGHKEDCRIKLALGWREQIRKGAKHE